MSSEDIGLCEYLTIADRTVNLIIHKLSTQSSKAVYQGLDSLIFVFCSRGTLWVANGVIGVMNRVIGVMNRVIGIMNRVIGIMNGVIRVTARRNQDNATRGR